LMGLVVDPQRPVEREFSLIANDSESLLVAFLNRILYEMEMDSIGFDHFDLQVEQFQVQAHLKGGEVVEVQKMIKAVTYHNLEIQQVRDGLVTTFVMDV
ncbi:archease, partial [bacterium]|nr:archease [bacterium]